MKKVFLSLVLSQCLSLVAAAQVDMSTPKAYPHSFIEGALDLNGGGYSPVSLDAHPGTNWETRDISLTATGNYSFAKKTNDGTVGNNTGHSRSLTGDVFYKINAYWMVGGGGDWGKTYTELYKKRADSWRVGGGRDWFNSDVSLRITAEYFRHFNESTEYPKPQTFTTPSGGTTQAYGCKCTNGVQGIFINFWEPSPYTAHHFFFHVSSSISTFHETITDPYNYVLTRQQKGTTYIDGSSTIGVVYRF
jgi:hypothetical protein